MGCPVSKFKSQLRNRSFSACISRGENLCGALHPRFSPSLLRQGRAAAVPSLLNFSEPPLFYFLFASNTYYGG